MFGLKRISEYTRFGIDRLHCIRITRVSASVKTAVAFSFVWHLQYIRITRMSALDKTTSAFSLVCCYIVCVLQACMHWIKTAFAFFFVSRYNAYDSHAFLCRLKRLLRFL